MYVCMYVCIYVIRTYVCMLIWMYLCMYVYMYLQCTMYNEQCTMYNVCMYACMWVLTYSKLPNRRGLPNKAQLWVHSNTYCRWELYLIRRRRHPTWTRIITTWRSNNIKLISEWQTLGFEGVEPQAHELVWRHMELAGFAVPYLIRLDVSACLIGQSRAVPNKTSPLSNTPQPWVSHKRSRGYVDEALQSTFRRT